MSIRAPVNSADQMNTINTTGVLNASEQTSVDCVGRGLTSPDHQTMTSGGGSPTVMHSFKRWLFNRFSILRSTSFRLGMMFWLLFTICFGLGLFGFYQTLQDQTLKQIDASIADRFAEVEKVYEQNGLEAVIQLAEAKSDSPMASSMGFHLSTTVGDRIAGNVPICLTELGWDVLRGEDLGLMNDPGTYRFFTASLGGNVLSMGKSMEDLEKLRRIALSGVLWMLAISTVLAFTAAVWFGNRVQRRVSYISAALDKVAAGNLLARLPVNGVGDDIDILSGKINSSLDRLELTVEGMRQVSTDIAHDLKTPLNRLFINIEGAADKSRSGECVGNDLEAALDEAQAINGTFEALLRIAQIEAGARKSQFRNFDLKEVLDTAAEIYAPVVEENDQVLVVDINPGADGISLPMVGDRSLMLQLVVNLIENGVNHCKQGTQIQITGGETDGDVWLRVADTGDGIPAGERDKVFQRLYRLQRSRTTRGSGLGLSLVKAISDLHSGKILLEDNEPGLSTTITFKAAGCVE